MVTTLGGARSIVGVPMFKDAALIGAIVIYREEVQPFTEKQIELVQNFAAQAVIAIENTRLLGELRELPAAADGHCRRTQGYQPLDVRLAAVLDTLVESAARLCRAEPNRNSDCKGWSLSSRDRLRLFARGQRAHDARSRVEPSRLDDGWSRAGRGQCRSYNLMRRPI